MKKELIVLAVLLTGCVPSSGSPNTTSTQPLATQSQHSEERAFSMPEIGVYSDMPKPEFVEVFVGKKYENIGDLHGRSRWDTFAETFGSLKNLDEFCVRKNSQVDRTTFDAMSASCVLQSKKSQHATYLFSEYQQSLDGTGKFVSLNREAVFLTASKVKPVILFWFPTTQDIQLNWESDDEVRKALVKEGEKPSEPEKNALFNKFVKSIEIRTDFADESEWLNYKDEELRFSFDYPNGMYVNDEPGYESGATISHRFYVIYTKTNPEAEIMKLEGDYYKRVEKSDVKIGQYPAKEYSYIVNGYQGKEYKDSSEFRFVIPSKHGYYTIRYDDTFKRLTDNTDTEIVDKILMSFKILE